MSVAARGLFHQSQYQWSAPVESLWEKDRPTLPAPGCAPLAADTTTDVAIIGGGYCGLSAALHLARAGIPATVLDAASIGWAASGRNGGFCCIGASWLGAGELKQAFGEQEALAFLRALAGSVRLVEELCDSEQIDAQRQGDGIWTFAHKPNRMDGLKAQAAALQQIGIAARTLSPEDFTETAFACTEQHGALFEPIGFGVHPLALCLGLARAAIRHGAIIHPLSMLTSWTREGNTHVLHANGVTVRARRVIVATNGWLPEDLVPALAGRVLPVLSNIIATAPLSDEQLARTRWHTQAPASNTRNHLAYLRLLPGRQLLFGGRGDTTGRPSGAAAMQRLLHGRMVRMFPALRDVQITHAWRGFIAATRRLTPALGELPDDPSVSYALGCHGNGVAFMTWAGRELAQRIAGTAGPLPAPVQGLPPRFPVPALRLWGLRGTLALAWLEDELL